MEAIDRIRQALESQNKYAIHLGQKLTEFSEGRAVLVLEGREAITNPLGTIHGGILFGLADTAAGGACYSGGHYVTTASAAIHYYRPGQQNDTLTAIGQVTKWGRRICFAECKIYNQNEDLLCHYTGSYAVLDEIPGLSS